MFLAVRLFLLAHRSLFQPSLSEQQTVGVYLFGSGRSLCGVGGYVTISEEGWSEHLRTDRDQGNMILSATRECQMCPDDILDALCYRKHR